MNVTETIRKLGTTPHKFGDVMSAEYPFFVTLSFIKIKETDEVPTAAIGIEGKDVVMYVNSAALLKMAQDAGLNKEETEAFIRGVAKHEILHFLFKHILPSPERPNHTLKNIVMDALINPIIPEFQHLQNRHKVEPITPEELLKGVSLPEGSMPLLCASIQAFEEWTWEEYYDALFAEAEKIQSNVYGSGMEGDAGNDNSTEGEAGGDGDLTLEKKIRKIPATGDIKPASEIPPEVEGKLEAVREKLIETMKSRGKMPGWLEREIELQRKNRAVAKVKRLLRKTFSMGNSLEKQDTWKRPSRRYDTFPGKKNTYVKRRAVALVDVSGSVGDRELTEAVKEICALSYAYGFEPKLYTYDVEIKKEIPYREFLRHGIKTEGGGGTNLKNVLDQLGEDVLKGAIVFVFTDGYDESPDKEDFKGAQEVVFVFYPNHSEDFKKAVAKYAATAVLG